MNTLPATVISRCDELQTSVNDLLVLKVTTTETSVRAGFALKTAKEARRDLEDLRKQLTKPLDDEKKLIMSEFYGRLATCDVVICHLETELKAFAAAERKRQEEERLRAEAQAKAEEEKERERLSQAAKQAEQNWDFLDAQKLEERSEMVRVPSVVIPEKRPLIRGLQERKVYRFKVVDLQLIPRDYLIPDEKALGELARRSKGQAVVPGVQFVEDTIIAG